MEFLTVVEFQRRSVIPHSGVDELTKVFEILTERQQQGRHQSKGPQWAIANRRLLNREDPKIPFDVYSLCPSDGEVNLFLSQIASLIPAERSTRKRLVALHPNHAAVVLWIRIGEVSILLGSDLEETSDPRTGWSVIVECEARPNGKASVFKIPHHGSRNADQPLVWQQMTAEKPYAILTPFARGKTFLPTVRDAERICQRTDNAYSTGIPQRRSVKRSPTVERTIRETVRSIKAITGTMGHVRLRTGSGGTNKKEWNVELFGNATHLSELLVAQ